MSSRPDGPKTQDRMSQFSRLQAIYGGGASSSNASAHSPPKSRSIVPPADDSESMFRKLQAKYANTGIGTGLGPPSPNYVASAPEASSESASSKKPTLGQMVSYAHLYESKSGSIPSVAAAQPAAAQPPAPLVKGTSLAALAAAASSVALEPGASPPAASPVSLAKSPGCGAGKGALAVRSERYSVSEKCVGQLKVHLKRASGLMAGDINLIRPNSSDPYVVMKCGGVEKRSRTIGNTLDPIWNESLVFQGELGNFLDTGLSLTVLDKDTFSKDDPLGSVMVPLHEFKTKIYHDYVEELPTQGALIFSVSWLADAPELASSATLAALEMMRPKPASTPALPPPPSTPMPVTPATSSSGNGPFQISLPEERDRFGLLTLTLMRAQGLKAADINGYSDPYVIARCGEQEKRSRTVRRSLDPKWDEELTFQGRLSTMINSGLLLRIFDHDMLTSDDLIGDVRVSLEELKTKNKHNYVQKLSTQGMVLFSLGWQPSTSTPDPSSPPPPSLPSTALPPLPPAAAAAPPQPPTPTLTPTPPMLDMVPSPVDRARVSLGVPPLPQPLPQPPPVDVELPSYARDSAGRSLLMAPLALCWAPVAAQLLALAFTAFAIVDTPAALGTVFLAIWRARRFGPIAKLLLWALALTLAALMIPLAALFGAAIGLTHGAYVGIHYLQSEGQSSDFLTAPVGWVGWQRPPPFDPPASRAPCSTPHPHPHPSPSPSPSPSPFTLHHSPFTIHHYPHPHPHPHAHPHSHPHTHPKPEPNPDPKPQPSLI